jgi:hypothetical protein
MNPNSIKMASSGPVAKSRFSAYGQEMKEKVASLILFGLSFAPSVADPISWTGRVIDARTGAPISGIECYGGGRGRVDLTPKALSDPDGNYVVTYEDELNLDSWEYYALDATDPLDRYYHYRRSHLSVEPLEVRMVPKLAFVQGVVREAGSGQPLGNIEISLGRPGRYIETIFTNPDGSFSFNHPAYTGRTNVETIPEGERAEGTGNNPTIPITDYWLRIDEAGYQPVNTATQGLTLTVLSSITNAIHTRVDIALASESAEPGSSTATSKLVTPPVSRITSSSLLNGQLGQEVSYQIVANNQPASYSAGGLPAGLVLEPTSGLITGVPETEGLYSVELNAEGIGGTASQRLTLVVRGGDREIFNNGNIGGVQSGPSAPTTFTLEQSTFVSFLSNYHYFNNGVLPGTIALRHDDGTTYGPWQASGRLGQGGVANANWDVRPSVVLKPGTYTVIDSHPATWSHNSQSGFRGFTMLHGRSTDLDASEVLATWAGNHGLTGEDAAPTADPDQDGQANWVELVTGNNPSMSDSPSVLEVARTEGQLTVQVPVCAGGDGVPGGDFVVNGARVAIEISSGLGDGTWLPAIELLDLVNATRENLGDGREVLILPVKDSPAARTRWFLRRHLTRIATPQ